MSDTATENPNQESNTPANTLSKNYEPAEVEAKLYKFWEDNNCFAPESQTNVSDSSDPFCIVIPPPNVTGNLHMGHALDNTIQDILIRWHRMRGDKTLWMPGLDHAGIATQSVVERQLKTENITRHDLGREKFLEKVWEWSDKCKSNIVGQFKRLGISPDWKRQRFTLDDGCYHAVREAFYRLYNDGLIYQGEYIVNWDPETQSAISDVETDYEDEDSFLWEIRYPVADSEKNEKLVVATTRPETMYGDVAVAVHPEDDRYKHLIGKNVVLPLTGKEIPIIADEYVDREFGTGALKITPAHDPNDFKIGQTHKLDPVIVIDEQGAIKNHDFIPESIRGLDRFEARIATETLLEAEGFLVRKVEHKHRVGRAQRSGAVIEPLLSKQWFVSTKPIAEKALKALDDGEIRFIPERWTKDYLRWMNNIQDWCISRQLWWGHQIPAWHCADCGKITVAINDPDACEHCESQNIQQDPDVLDTWFSSGLWPFSTMGWPDENASDLKTYYPTSVLVTGFDIIFFWVARMTMFGHQMTEKSPFHTVYIHGLIRDEKGQKMSKSKGNTIDPVELINEVGCDGFRFALTSLITYGGQDIKLNKDKIELGRVYANKLWNASRFVLMNLEGENAPDDCNTPVDNAEIDRSKLTTMDRWILSQYNTAVKKANENLDEYKFGELADLCYEFTWNNLCDWYVEYAKKQLRDPELADNTRRILLHVLSGTLRMQHPIMPFITEEIYQKLPHQPSKSVMLADYPVADTSLIDEKINSDTDFVLETVRALRNIRQQYNVPPKQAVKAMIETTDDAEKSAVQTGMEIIQHFVQLDSFDVLEKANGAGDGAAVNVVGHSRIMVPLEGLIDVEQERERISKKLEGLTAEQDKLFKMMGNHDFLQNAPDAVVNKNKARLEEITQQVQVLNDQMSAMK